MSSVDPDSIGVQDPLVQEPLLEVDEIQGNILLGFNKTFQALAFLEIGDLQSFRGWLDRLLPRITTTRQVERGRSERRAHRIPPTTPGLWQQIGFSSAGLARLLGPGCLAGFVDSAFIEGLACRSASLGDPTEGEGSPPHWSVGGPGNEPHVVLVVAGDVQSEVHRELDGIRRDAAELGFRVMDVHFGERLKDRDREHFGFRDGLSQPAVRGRLSSRVLLTARSGVAPLNQNDAGQTLVWPGEFVFGYPSQDPNAIAAVGGVAKRLDTDEAPEWARNGSFLVYRRLRQDVGAFRAFVREQALALEMAESVLEAKIVGRFRDGAPIVISALDDPTLASDEQRLNNFDFRSIDPNAIRCPFAAHIRKAYPRGDDNRFFAGGGQVDAETHRIIRRGIPYGSTFDDNSEEQQREERGLLFLAYQTSISEQFEHIHRTWANATEIRHLNKAPFSAGHDLIIGRSAHGPRSFVLRLSEDNPAVLTARDWICPMAGGYFFVPSIGALRGMAANEL